MGREQADVHGPGLALREQNVPDRASAGRECAPGVLWIGWLVGNYAVVPSFPWRRDMQVLIQGV